MIRLKSIKPNPQNPRIIKDTKFQQLVANVLKYPKFLYKRPIVHKDSTIQGGNMRFRALEHLIKLSEPVFLKLAEEHSLTPELIDEWKAWRKAKSVPNDWIVNADDFTEDEVKAFTIVDNVSFGSWNWDDLANGWDDNSLEGWGLDLPGEKLLEQQVSFTVKKPSATDDQYSTFEQVMLHSNKQILVETLNQIKDEQKFEMLEESLMYLVKYYHQHKN